MIGAYLLAQSPEKETLRGEIVDVYRRIINTEQTTTEKARVEINTSGFSSGVYIVRVMGNGTIKEKGRFNIMK